MLLRLIFSLTGKLIFGIKAEGSRISHWLARDINMGGSANGFLKNHRKVVLYRNCQPASRKITRYYSRGLDRYYFGDKENIDIWETPWVFLCGKELLKIYGEIPEVIYFKLID